MANNSFTNTTRGNLVLHEACKSQPTVEAVEALLGAFPEAAHTKGQWGYLPLHYAASSGASLEVVKLLLKVYPAATRNRDDYDGVFPLHLACKWGTSPEVLTSIMVNYPEGIYVRDNNGKTPKDHAEAQPESEAKDKVLEGLEIGPMFCAVSKAAQNRTCDETESRLRGMADAHSAHMRRFEERRIQERDQQRQVVDQLKADLHSVSFQFTDFQHEITDLKDETRALKQGKTALEEILSNERDDHERKITEILSKMEESRKEFTSLIANRDSTIAGLEDANEHKAGEISTLQRTLKTAEEERDAWKKAAEEEKEVTKQLTTKVEELSVYPGIVQTRDETIKNLETNIEVHEKAEHALATNAVLLQKARSETEHDLRVALAERDSIRQRKDEIQKDLTDAKKCIEAYKNRLSILHGWVQSLDGDMNTWNVEDAVVTSPVPSLSGRQVAEEKKDDEFSASSKVRQAHQEKEANPPTREVVIVNMEKDMDELDIDDAVKEILVDTVLAVSQEQPLGENPHEES